MMIIEFKRLYQYIRSIIVLVPLRSIFLVALALFSSRLSGSEFNDDIIVAWAEGSQQSGFPVKETVLTLSSDTDQISIVEQQLELLEN